MVKVASLIERAEYFRARAIEVRRIASTLPDEAMRETLRSIAADYDRLAKAQDQLILAKSNIALLAPDGDKAGDNTNKGAPVILACQTDPGKKQG